MSVFNQAFSPEMSPSIDERTVADFQRAHGLVRGIISSKGGLTAENVHAVVQECFEAVNRSFSEETRSQYNVEVQQFVRDAKSQLEQLRDEIESVEESASQIVRNKRSGEQIQEKQPQAKKYRERSPIPEAKDDLPLVAYNRLLTVLGSPQLVQELYLQLSPSTIETWKQLEKSEEAPQQETFWLEGFREISELGTPELMAQRLNQIFDVFRHLRSFESPPSIRDCLTISTSIVSSYPTTADLYPEEEPSAVWKRLLNPEAIGMLQNYTDQEQYRRLVLSEGSREVFEILSSEIYSGLLAKLGTGKQCREFLSNLSPTTLRTMGQMAEEFRGNPSETWSDDITRMYSSASDPKDVARLLNQISDIIQHLRSFESPPNMKKCYRRAISFLTANTAIPKLFPGEDPVTVLKRLLTPETFNMTEDMVGEEALYCLVLSENSKERFYFLEGKYNFFDWNDLESVKPFLLLFDKDPEKATIFVGSMLPTSLKSSSTESLSLLQQWLQDPRVTGAFQYVHDHSQKLFINDLYAVARWYIWFNCPSMHKEAGPKECPFDTGFPWTPEEESIITETLCREFVTENPQATARRILDVFRHIRSLDSHLDVQSCFTIASRSMQADYLIEQLFPGEEPIEVWKKLLNREIIDSLEGVWNGYERAVISRGSKPRFDFLRTCFSFFNWKNPEILELFLSLSDQELSRIQPFIEKLESMESHGELTPPLSDAEKTYFIRQQLQNKRLKNFKQHVHDHPGEISEDDEYAVMKWNLWFSIQSIRKTPPPHSECPLMTGFPWTQEEVETILQSYGPNTKAMRFWDAEMTGRLEEEISRLPLDTLPTELLMRFLGSKPFPEIQAWLQTTINTLTGPKARVDTLSEAQKNAILRHFRGDDTFALSPEGWRQLLHTSEEEARRICRQEETPAPAGAEGYQNTLSSEFDPEDPTSFLKLLGEGNNTEALVEGLVKAKVESLCGERTFLTWGGASAGSSACVARDAQPVFFRDHEQSLAIYPRGLFNDPSFGVSALSLRRRLIALMEKNPEEYAQVLNETDCEKFQSQESFELALELKRVQLHIRRKLSTTDLDAPRAGIFRDHLKRSCLEGAEAAERGGMPKVDLLDTTPRAAFLFLSLLQIARNTQVHREEGNFLIKIGPGLAYRVESFESPDIRKLKEDNPGIEDLESYAEDFPLHSLTPVTPKNVTPESFQQFVSTVQGLTETQYRSLCDSCVRLASQDLGEYPSIAQCFEEWKKLWPQDVRINEEGFHALTAVAAKYFPYVATARHADEESGSYPLSHFPEEFCPREQVPSWLPTSNFSGAICASFIPHNPKRHDGSCGVNSFLLGYYGPEAYEGENARKLSEDINGFRRSVVAYAQEHKEELCEEFGTKEINDIIAHYGSGDWTGQGVWAIAARLYGREIRIYSAETHGNLFRRENFTLVPFDEHDVFKPKEEPKGPPIDIVYFGGVHYANLEPKPKDVEMSS
jgi:hypothetical protein